MNGLDIKNLKIGDRVRHTTFGEGLVTKYESAPGDAIVTIAFDHSNNGAKRFLLSHTPLENTEEQIKELKKIEERVKEPEKNKTSHSYSTEFKYEAVKQALSEGRAATRKQHDLPEATLRRWIKELS